MTTQTAVEYDKPQIEEKINQKVDGVLTRIVGYEFSSYSESVPGSNRDRNGMQTSIEILVDVPGTPYPKPLVFNGFVGSELVGQKVQYEDRIKTTTTFFNPEGRENDSSYRRGKRETERICRLTPTDSKLPSYTFKETSQQSL